MRAVHLAILEMSPNGWGHGGMSDAGRWTRSLAYSDNGENNIAIDPFDGMITIHYGPLDTGGLSGTKPARI